MQIFDAYFFDGQTSRPHQSNLTIDSGAAELCFRYMDADVRWAVKDISIHQLGNNVEVQNKNFPDQHIRVENKEFALRLKELLKTYDKLSVYQRLLDLGFKLHLIIAAFILGVIVLAYLYVLPAVAEHAAVLIPKTYDTQVGNTFWNSYKHTITIDSAKSNTLQQFAEQLKLHNSQKLTFVVVRSETVNAFALPNGTIVVYTGILKEMKSYDELAGLLGHEVAHVNNRHSMKMMCRNLAGYLFLSAVLSDVNGIMAVIGDNVNSLRSLTYSRTFEKEADMDAVALMAENNIKPDGMVSLFKHIQKKGDISMPEFISSHPMTEKRIAYIQNEIVRQKVSEISHPKMQQLFKELKEGK